MLRNVTYLNLKGSSAYGKLLVYLNLIIIMSFPILKDEVPVDIRDIWVIAIKPRGCKRGVALRGFPTCRLTNGKIPSCTFRSKQKLRVDL